MADSWRGMVSSSADSFTRPANGTENGKEATARDFSWLPRRLVGAIVPLLEAHQYAEHLGNDDWDFSISFGSLRSEGLTETDVRWLVHAGFVDFAYEVSLPGEATRQYRRSENLVFSESLCFVLTVAGIEFAREWMEAQDVASSTAHLEGCGISLPIRPSEPTCDRTPRWDRDRQELRVGELVVKRFKAPAANQETILAAFEEEEWPPRIDDPLPPSPDLEPKRRLHDTINSLNRNQKKQLLRFFGDGSGMGIRWELVNEGESNGQYP